MANFFELSLLQKLVLAQNKPSHPGFQQAAFHRSNMMMQNVHPAMNVAGWPQSQQLVLNNSQFAASPSLLGKHSCSVKPPTVFPTQQVTQQLTQQVTQPFTNRSFTHQGLATQQFMNQPFATQTPTSRPLFSHNLPTALQPQTVTILPTQTPTITVPIAQETTQPSSQVPQISWNSKKINDVYVPAIKTKEKASKAVKRIWYLPREKKVRKTACQIVRTFKCTSPGCSKAYGSETSLKVHIKNKHSSTDDEKTKDSLSVKAEELF